jgi:hypothetical protein
VNPESGKTDFTLELTVTPIWSELESLISAPKKPESESNGVVTPAIFF